MKRSLTSALVLVVLVVVGLLLLTVKWSAGSRLGRVSSDALTPGATPSIAATLTYSDYQTLTAGDIWAIPTPVHTPVIPTEWPFLPKPTYPTSTPRPTPTLLPDMGVRIGAVNELTVQKVGDASLQFEDFPRIVYLDTDGKTLVGIITLEGKLTNQLIAIDLFSGNAHIVEEEGFPYEPQVYGNHVVWTTLDRVHLYNLSNRQLEQLDSGIARYAQISEQVVVWEQGAVDIWGYDLSTGQKFSVATNPEVIEERPEFSADWVVYRVRGLHSCAELRATNIRTHEDIRLGEVLPESPDAPDVFNQYVVDAPWVVWTSEAELHLYNLDTRTPYTITVEPCIVPTTEPGREPRHLRLRDLAMSKNTVIFVCNQRIGYDIERKVFFSLNVRESEITKGNFTEWAISDDLLVWVLTEDAFGTQERSHIYTAQIECSP